MSCSWAFILLGPSRMVDAARLLGKASREIRRMSEELPRLTLDEAEGPAEERPSPNNVAGAAGNGRPESPSSGLSEDDGQVRFQPSDSANTGEKSTDGEPDKDGQQ